MLELMKVSTINGLNEYRFSMPTVGAEKIEHAIQAILDVIKYQEPVDDDQVYTAEEVLGSRNPATILRGFRYREDLTQKQLAAALGIKQHRISDFERGVRKISPKMATRLADFFGTSASVFL